MEKLRLGSTAVTAALVVFAGVLAFRVRFGESPQTEAIALSYVALFGAISLGKAAWERLGRSA